ncbi:6,7-dimethyl-8-ribityllumazine synthase [bacterium]|nr:6,7-dimethyl-8-ribityllumazine synthase [bacterium]
MSGYLPKRPSEFHKIPHARLAIIASMWHRECVQSMIDRACRELDALGVKAQNISVHYLPGAYELPLAAQLLFEREQKLDAILAFGVVLKGGTTHDLTVLQNVVQGFAEVSRRYGKPIINEVIGVVKIEDAVKRSADDLLNKGLEAVFAVSELLHWNNSLKPPA